MAYRAYWTGQFKMGLLMFPIQLVTATTDKGKVRFNQIHEPTGNRVHQVLAVTGVGEIDRSEIVRGYEYEKGRYVTVTDEELACLKLETTETMEVQAFVAEGTIPEQYIGQPYYLRPDGLAAHEAYRAIRDALTSSGTLAIARVVMSMNERTIMIRPYENGLIGNALRYPEEIKSSQEVFDGIDNDPSEAGVISLVEQLIDQKLVPFDPYSYKDHYQDAVRELVDAKLSGVSMEHQVARPPKVVNLIDALKASLGEAKLNEKKPKPKKPKKAA